MRAHFKVGVVALAVVAFGGTAACARKRGCPELNGKACVVPSGNIGDATCDDCGTVWFCNGDDQWQWSDIRCAYVLDDGTVNDTGECALAF